MKTTKNKIEKLESVLNDINKRELYLFNFSVEKEDNSVLIIDDTEEFYYDGFAFDRIYDEIENIVKKLFGKNCYIDCVCPGRWVVAE